MMGYKFREFRVYLKERHKEIIQIVDLWELRGEVAGPTGHRRERPDCLRPGFHQWHAGA